MFKPVTATLTPTGIIRKTDDLGRIVIPMELRKAAGIEPGTPMEIFAAEGWICIRKFEAGKELTMINDSDGRNA